MPAKSVVVALFAVCLFVCLFSLSRKQMFFPRWGSAFSHIN